MSMLYLYQFDNQDYETQEEGCQLLQKAIEDCHLGLNLYDETMSKYKDGFYCNLGKCYYRLEQYDSCVYYVEKQIDFMNAMHYEIVPHPENAALFYRLYKSYEALGKEEKALEAKVEVTPEDEKAIAAVLKEGYVGPRVYHVSHRNDKKWQVKFANGKKAIKLFDTQAEAIVFAKKLAKAQDGSIRIHSLTGRIRKEH